MKIGYARVSTIDRNPNAQTDALKAKGCDTIVTETASGASEKLPELAKLMRSLAPGDVVTVWRLDRLGRSPPHLIATVRDLEEKGAHLVSLMDGIDTTTAQGRLTFHIMSALAEFERSLMVERTQAVLQAARDSEMRLGRPKSLSGAQIKHA